MSDLPNYYKILADNTCAFGHGDGEYHLTPRELFLWCMKDRAGRKYKTSSAIYGADNDQLIIGGLEALVQIQVTEAEKAKKCGENLRRRKGHEAWLFHILLTYGQCPKELLKFATYHAVQSLSQLSWFIDKKSRAGRQVRLREQYAAWTAKPLRKRGKKRRKP